ncbi:integrase core domain protein [Trichinella nativa]|uniref:Integrase core domain protein n=1 Tax=Trichinella nativa TaxID=6335 RepID=A0A1Y3EBW8_9BILA|nr:integrase core domain protein [Trichinella nativa]
MEEYNGRTTHTVAIANGTNITTKGIGVVKIPLATEKTLVAHDVRHALELALNLLSVSRIAAQKKTLIFDENGCRIVDLAVEVLRQHILGTATQYNGLYRLNRCDHWAMAVQDVPDLWHRRLGHLSRGSMKLLQDGQATGIPSDAITKTDCVTCLKGKQCRLPFPKSATKRSEEVLELVHSDICGPMQVASVGGARYFLSFIDDFSRKSFAYFLKHKNEALPKFKDFIAMVERQTSKRVKCLRTDNGREYVNNMFAEFLMRKGIRHERTIPETPQQNGVAERMNRTLVEKARTMLIDANLSPDLWAEAVGTANYLRNRCTTKALRKVIPEEAWSGRKPNLAHLKVFGCLAMVHVASGQRKKWDLKSEERIFVGYCETSKGYRTVDCKTKKMYVTRDVKFLESRFPGTQASKEESTNSLMNPDVGEEAVIVWTSQDSGSTEMDPNPSVPPKVDTDSDESIGQSPQPSVKTSPEELRRPPRDRFPNRNIFNSDFLLFQAQVREQSDSISYEEAVNRPDAKEWLKAINEELASHCENQSWEPAVLPPHKKAIKSKWVFKTKYKEDRTIEKRKARLVARGYSQLQGIDYEDTFAPTLGYSSLRYLLSLAAKYNLEVDQMDVVTAFLNPSLNEEIYMELPTGVGDENNKYCRLRKSIYGLKQASRAWYGMLDDTLRSFGLNRLKNEPCIYFLWKNKIFLAVGVYVDDLLILSNNESSKNELKMALCERFKMKDLGKAHWCLGIRIMQDVENGTLSIDQEQYIEELLHRFRMSDCKGVKTPLDHNQALSKAMMPRSDEEIKQMHAVPYREAVGCLVYLSQSCRPDICHAVAIVSRFSDNPGKAHWTAVKRIF